MSFGWNAKFGATWRRAEPTLKRDIAEEVAQLHATFAFGIFGDVWTPGRRSRVANMHMHSWDELHRTNINPPPHNVKPYWAGVSNTQEERAHSATITVAFKALRAAFEAQDDTRNLPPNADPDYRTSSIFVNDNVWIKLIPKKIKLPS